MKISGNLALYFLPVVICLCSSEAMSAAFQLKEQSSSKLGNAFAGYTADADDISIMWQNPAAMTMFKGTQSLVSTSIIIPKTELKSSNTSSTFGFTGTGSAGAQSDIGHDSILPALYFMYDPGGDKNYRFGLSVNRPYGMKTSYNANAVSRYSGLTSEIKTITVSPSLAYQINDNWSIGGGPQVQHFDIRLTRAINCGEIANVNSAAIFGTDGGALDEDCHEDNTADDIATGFVTGIHANYDRFKLGLAYRSKVTHDLSGDVRITQSSLVSGIAALSSTANELQSQGINAKVTTPENVNIGASYDLTPSVTLLADAVWTRWSHLQDLEINYDNNILGQSSRSDTLNYENSWFLSFGVDYDYNENLTFRGGVAYDWSPIPEETRSSILPDQDRLWLTAGLGYNFNQSFSLDLSYAHISADTALVSKEENVASAIPAFVGEYDSSVNIFGLQVDYKF